MSELRKKIRRLDNLNLRSNDANDLIYEILDELLDRIEVLERENENKPEVGTKIA